MSKLGPISTKAFKELLENLAIYANQNLCKADKAYYFGNKDTKNQAAEFWEDIEQSLEELLERF